MHDHLADSATPTEGDQRALGVAGEGHLSVQFDPNPADLPAGERRSHPGIGGDQVPRRVQHHVDLSFEGIAADLDVTRDVGRQAGFGVEGEVEQRAPHGDVADLDLGRRCGQGQAGLPTIHHERTGEGGGCRGDARNAERGGGQVDAPVVDIAERPGVPDRRRNSFQGHVDSTCDRDSTVIDPRGDRPQPEIVEQVLALGDPLAGDDRGRPGRCWVFPIGTAAQAHRLWVHALGGTLLALDQIALGQLRLVEQDTRGRVVAVLSVGAGGLRPGDQPVIDQHGILRRRRVRLHIAPQITEVLHDRSRTGRCGRATGRDQGHHRDRGDPERRAPSLHRTPGHRLPQVPGLRSVLASAVRIGRIR